MKLIDLYKEWMETGRITGEKNNCPNGLCSAVPEKYCDSLLLFKPSTKELNGLRDEYLSQTYWASGLDLFDSITNKESLFSPLRQTIVLLICCILEEY